MTTNKTQLAQSLYCSFCGKSQAEVGKLIAGPSVYICNECISLCNDIIESESVPESEKEKVIKPKDVYDFLNEYVIGQSDAKMKLAVAVYNHYKRLNLDCDDVELGKSNILLIGPSGTGKTLLAQSLARLIDVPFAIADATSLTEAGYVGDDVETVLSQLLARADYDVERAQRGIVYIDEIDKISRSSNNPSITKDVSGAGVQQSLLKLIEGTVSNVMLSGDRKHPKQEQVQVDTSNILFICGGAFSGLDDVIKQREDKSSIGFSASIISNDDESSSPFLENLESEDLIKYGLIPEFIGRLPVIAVLDKLSDKDLTRVLLEPKNSLVKQYKKLFEIDGVELVIEDDAILEIAVEANKKETGARGLRSVIERILLPIMFEVPSLENVEKVLVTKEIVKTGASPIILYKKSGLTLPSHSK